MYIECIVIQLLCRTTPESESLTHCRFSQSLSFATLNNERSAPTAAVQHIRCENGAASDSADAAAHAVYQESPVLPQYSLRRSVVI